MVNQSNNDNKLRYSDEELEEFRQMIDAKIAEAQKQLEQLREQLTELNESDETSKAGTFEDGASNWQRERINELASRQQRFIRDLEYALVRIKNKTYGVCSVTGKLIDKKRLMLVPHATKSVEGKQTENEDTKVRKPLDKKINQPKKVISKVITPKKKNSNGDGYEFIDDDDDFPQDDPSLDLDGLVLDDNND